jgi:hypothetical protein
MKLNPCRRIRQTISLEADVKGRKEGKMRTIKEFFESKRAQCARLVEELEALNSTLSDIQTKYFEDDKICVLLAGKLTAARLAQSPTCLSLEAELKQARWNRDRGKRSFNARKDDLCREIESFTREPIKRFHQECLDLVKSLSKLYKFERLEPSHNPLTGKRLRWDVKVSHNSAALTMARDRVFEAIRDVQDMIHCSLEDVEKRITEYKLEFANFDLKTMQIEVISESLVDMMQPQRDVSGNLQPATLLGDGKVLLHPMPGEAGRLDALNDRISNLEKKL